MVNDVCQMCASTDITKILCNGFGKSRFLRGWLGEPEIMPLKTLIALSQWSCQVSMILSHVSKREGYTHDWYSRDLLEDANMPLVFVIAIAGQQLR